MGSEELSRPEIWSKFMHVYNENQGIPLFENFKPTYFSVCVADGKRFSSITGSGLPYPSQSGMIKSDCGGTKSLPLIFCPNKKCLQDASSFTEPKFGSTSYCLESQADNIVGIYVKDGVIA